MPRDAPMMTATFRSVLTANLPCSASFQRRERCRLEDLVADARDDGAVALAVVAGLVPGGVVLERRPPRLAVRQRLPREHVGQLVAGFPDEGRPEADGTDAVLFPDGNGLVPEAGQQLGHSARDRLVDAQLVDHRKDLRERKL